MIFSVMFTFVNFLHELLFNKLIVNAKNVFAKWVGSGFPSKKGWDGGINGKKWAGKWDLRSLLGTLLIIQRQMPYPSMPIVSTSKLGFLYQSFNLFRKECMKTSQSICMGLSSL